MDVDIDFPTSFNPLEHFDTAIPASRVQNGVLKKHNAGIYFQQIPVDPITNLAAIPYNRAESYGYYKIDFLHLSMLDNFKSKHEIRTLIKLDPDWKMVEDENIVAQLFQLHNNFKIVKQVAPTSRQELADCIALIRPAKRHLVTDYVVAKINNTLPVFRSTLYEKPEDGRNYFKRAHAVAYATTIVLQLHLIAGGIT